MLLLEQSYQYKPFITPLPAWDYWMWLIVPLCIGVALVYKTARCESIASIFPQTLKISLIIFVSMALAALFLSGLTWVMTPV
jgi:hypothetical protein